MTAFNRLHFIKRGSLFGLACLPLALAAAGCGGDEPASGLSCGPGTERDGRQCVPAGTGSGGDGAGGEGNAVPGAPRFAGIESTAPASDVAVQITWEPAEDEETSTERLVYNVYAASASGEQNFGRPTAVSAPGSTSLLVGNLDPDTEYFFVVRALNEAGVEDGNTTELAGTPELDTDPPTFAGATAAEAVGASSIAVSWDPADDDKSPAAGISYVVRWATSAEGAPTGPIGAISAPGATSIVVEGLPAPDSDYYFTVFAQDAAGNVADNSEVVSGTTGSDTTAPTFGGCTAVADPGSTTAMVSWVPGRDDTTVPEELTYNVYAFTAAVTEDTAFGVPVSSFVGGTQGRVEGLAAGTSYYFVCRAADVSTNEDTNIAFRTLTTLVDGEAPVFDGLETTIMDSTSAVLKWSLATDPGDQTPQNEIVYLVYRSESAATVFDDSPIAQSNPGAITIKVDGLDSNTQYYWGVRAQDKALNIDDNTTNIEGKTLVSLALDVQPILTQFCVKSGCHGRDNPPQGLNMSAGFAYTNLVNVPAIQRPAFDRVEPGAPDNSYMIKKLIGDLTVIGGEQMPPVGNEAPGDENIAIIRQWIQEGAGNN